MTAPRGSLPMYFPSVPFALTDAVSCAVMVEVAYDQCSQWINQGYPSGANFVWTPQATTITYSYSAPLIWSYDWLGVSTTNRSASSPRPRTETLSLACAAQ